MIYALTQSDAIVQVGALPKLWHDGTRWHDWRTDAPATNPADYGWLPVAETPRPDDTATMTHDRAVELVAGVPTVTWTPRPWTATEQADRAERSARLDNLAARVARIEAHLWSAPPDPTIPDDPTVADWAELGGIWPNDGLLREGGIIWRNVSGVPLTTPPSGFPGMASQWTRLFVVALAPEPEPPAPTVAAWAVGISAVGPADPGGKPQTVMSHAGRLWRCKVTHVTHAGWVPSAATHAVWTDIGPA